MAIEQVRRPSQLDMAGIRPPLQRTPSWSPHLWHDRSSLGRRRSLFIVPSVDERAEGRALNKRNVQIVLFAVGYIFPLGKMKPGRLFRSGDADLLSSLVHCLFSTSPTEIGRE